MAQTKYIVVYGWVSTFKGLKKIGSRLYYSTCTYKTDTHMLITFKDVCVGLSQQ